MDRVKRNLGKILAWLLVGACAVINVMLFGSAAELPTLSGAGAAQADLGLYLVLRAIGIPVIIVSVVFVAATFFVRERGKGVAGVLRYNYGAGIMALVNGLIPMSIMYWLVAVWKH